MTLPRTFRKSQERFLINYNYLDLASGLGFVDFYLTISGGSQSVLDYILDSSKRGIATIDGKLATAAIYDFRTSKFNLPRTLKGDAYLYGEVVYSSGTVTIKGEVFIFDDSAITLGSVTWNDATENSTTNQSFTLVKTVDNIDDYVYQSTNEVKKTGTFDAWIYHKYTYADGNTFDTPQQHGNASEYFVRTFTNPHQSKVVDKIQVYIRTAGASMEVFEQETDVYKADGITETSISDNIVSQDITANSGFLIKIPLTQTNIKGGEKVMVKLTLSAGGNITIDPLALFATEQTTILSLPFRIDS